MLDVLEREDVVKKQPGEDEDHFYCIVCDPEGRYGFCGYEFSDEEEDIGEGDHVSCVVCDNTTVCPRCGDDFSDEIGDDSDDIRGFEVVYMTTDEWLRNPHA